MLLKQVNMPNTPKTQRENEASEFRKVLANVRARLRGSGRKLTN